MKYKLKGLFFLSALVPALASFVALSANMPGDSIFKPCPLYLVLLAFSGIPIHFVSIVPAILFMVWNIQLFRGELTLPIRTRLIFIVMAVLSLYEWRTGREYGYSYQGFSYTNSLLIINVCFIGIMLFPTFLPKSNTPAWLCYVYPIALFTWIFSYAFPYLGETP